MTNAEFFKKVFGLEVNPESDVCLILSCKACGRRGNACEYAFEDFWKQEANCESVVELQGDVANKFYLSGLKVAWDMARKIVLSGKDGGFGETKVVRMFDNSWYDVMLNTKPTEVTDVMDKYNEYIMSTANLEIGDELENDARRCIVIKIVNDDWVNVLYLDKEESANGCVGYIDPHKYKRTGKKYPQIDELLKLLGGESDD